MKGWPKGSTMAGRPLAQEQELLHRVQGQCEQTVGQVMTAVNADRDGHWIDDSGIVVNDMMNDLKRRVYQEALQARTNGGIWIYHSRPIIDSTVSAVSADESKGWAKDRPAAKVTLRWQG
ncbi:MAG: hypothetical protein IT440_13925, partial [Phycisphaeraceae bacterium]|nr:hypothetical protein [Phycisphaeraceae bacterium]